MKTVLSMMTCFLFITFLTTPSSATTQKGQAACEVSNIYARYAINRPLNNSQVELELIRGKNRVAHHYPQTQITEAWEQNKVGKIKPTRYFDAYARAIEYQPTERVHGKIEKDWSYRYQLLSQSLLEKDAPTKAQSTNCNSEQSITIEQNQTRFEIVFLPNQQLVKEFSIYNATNQRIEHWKLKSVSQDKTAVDTFFETRESYKSTDFADIGDDHTDPFLTQMVTVGFIEAGASGFYQADEHGEVHSMGTHHH